MLKKFLTALLTTSVTLAFAGNGEFFQLDQSADGGSFVAAKGIGDVQLTAAYSQWNTTGKSLSGGLMKTVFNEAGATKLSIGLGGITHHSDATALSGSASAVGLKVSGETFHQLSSGSLYTLVEVNSAFNTWLGVVQFNPNNSNFGLEWTAVGDDRWYVGHRIAMRWKLGDSPWSIRAGRQTESAIYFVGLSYNTF